MIRDSQKSIEKAYRKVYAIADGVNLTAADDEIINNAVYEICKWQGFFPGETNAEDVVNYREKDARGVSGDITNLIPYFRKLGLYNTAYADWWNIFYIYKTYVQSDPTGVNHPINVGYKEEVPKAEVTRDGNADEIRSANDNEAVSTEPISIDYNKENPKEDNEMAINGNMTVGDAIGGGASLSDLANAARNANANFLGQTGGVPTNVGVPANADDAQKAAQAYAQASEKDRKAYASANKISLFLINQEPLSKRIPANVTTGKCADPKAKRDSILTKVWAGEQQPAGMINGKVNGEYVVPNSVACINQSEKYIQFMTELEQACDNPDHEFEIRKSSNLAPFKGVKFTENGVEKVIKWSELKNLVYEKTMSQLFVEGSDGILVQLGKARIGKDKVIKDVSDLLVLNVVGKNDLVDTAEGTIKDSAHVAFVYKTTDNVVNDKQGVRSALSFQYMKKRTADDASTSSRKTNVNLMLQVPQYDVVLASADFDALKASRGVGRVVTKMDATEQANMMVSLFKEAILNDTVTGGLAESVQNIHSANQAADAANAEQMAANGQF